MDDHPSRTDDAGDTPGADPAPGYAEALAELENILAELEASDVDVDTLASRVTRATELIALCRERIGTARMRIDEVIADLDRSDQPERPPATG
jgi:exodeoxyribonuclease VII small subunit